MKGKRLADVETVKLTSQVVVIRSEVAPDVLHPEKK